VTADKVKRGIIVRTEISGEKMITVTGEELELLESDLVIADEEKILALAGIKGGNSAEVDENTKNIIIESANFNPVTTRKTARRVKILTDASKRYENGITSEKASIAISYMLSLIIEVAHTENLQIAWITDVYPNPEEKFVLEFTQEHTARLLGFDISESEINKILEKFKYSYSVENGNYKVSIPFERLDLRIQEDMIEEIGRLYGYHNIPLASIDDINFTPDVNVDFYIAQKLRNYFVEKGFTEIMNYTFVNKGEVELYNPLASDKKALQKIFRNK
jgi:phenylalanyl-tRNA synthetase beta chain